MMLLSVAMQWTCSALGFCADLSGAGDRRAVARYDSRSDAAGGPQLSSGERISLYGSTIAFQWLAAANRDLAIGRSWLRSGGAGAAAGRGRHARIVLGAAMAAALASLQIVSLRQLARLPVGKARAPLPDRSQADAAGADRGAGVCRAGGHRQPVRGIDLSRICVCRVQGIWRRIGGAGDCRLLRRCLRSGISIRGGAEWSIRLCWACCWQARAAGRTACCRRSWRTWPWTLTAGLAGTAWGAQAGSRRRIVYYS